MKILIVEDDKVQCKMYEEEIEAFNNEHNNKIEYVIKNNSKEALNIIESDFDAAIIDLNLREENENYSGNLVIQSIFEKKRIPIYIVSGTPNEYDPITALEGKKFLLKKIKRDEKSLYEIFEELTKLYNTGVTKILNRNGILDKIMDEIFLKYSETLINELLNHDEIKNDEKEKIISRFCAGIINEKLKHTSPKYHPCEIYYTPPIKPDITTGDILVQKEESNSRKIILTPACDLEKRKDGKRKVSTILVADLEKIVEVLRQVKDENMDLQHKSDEKIIKDIKNGQHIKNYYVELPINNSESYYINFSKLSCLDINEIENKYIRESSISETFLKEIIFNFSKHYGRQGIPELYKI